MTLPSETARKKSGNFGWAAAKRSQEAFNWNILAGFISKNLSVEEIKASGFDKYYVDHTLGIWPQAAGGIPFNACVFQVKGDPITDLTEDLAAEQKARSTYDNILRLISDPEICDPIRFLRQREIVHFQRFGEALVHVQEGLPKNVYAYNPAFDNKKHC